MPCQSDDFSHYKDVPFPHFCFAEKAGHRRTWTGLACHTAGMVLSSLDNRDHTAPVWLPDAAACRGKSWLARLLLGAMGGGTPFLPCQSHHGCWATRERDRGLRTTPASQKRMLGRWERCNCSPTGGRQHAGDSMSGGGADPGEYRTFLDAVVPRGATCADRRIAQACKAPLSGGYGEPDLRVSGRSAGNMGDTPWPARAVDSGRVGKPGAWNICPAKGLSEADRMAKFAPMRGVPDHLETGRFDWRTWEPLQSLTTSRIGVERGSGTDVG